MKKILLVTDGFFHPPFLGRQALRKTLAGMAGFEFQHIRSLEKLPGNLKGFSALVIYIHHQEISPAALDKLDEFVSNGGGILGVHSATACFKEQLHYFEILGGRFSGHGPVAPFEVAPAAESEIFAGIPAFSVTDELYLHELQPGITAHFTAVYAGEEIPVVWTYHYGQGRVCYAVPGHTTASMRHPAVQEILRRGLEWVSKVDRVD